MGDAATDHAARQGLRHGAAAQLRKVLVSRHRFACTDQQLVGTQGKYTTDEVSSFLKDLIVARMTDLLGSMKVSMLDLPAKFDEVAGATRLKVSDEFAKYGLELVDFFINSITPPEEVQKAIDARSSMGAIGDLHAFTMFQAANSMAKMAEQGAAAVRAATPWGWAWAPGSA